MNDYKKWVENATEDAEISSELRQAENDEEAISDRFYRELEFGTGGLRGVIGAGTNRMNIYTVRKATQGFSEYLNSEYNSPSVAIAYDSRKNSEKFAMTAAEVFAANGIKAYIFEKLMPTPMLSFAVRELKCSGGIVITASHNPKEYNGYKVYGDDGCQITLDAAEKITGYISKIDVFSGVKHEAFDKMMAGGMIEYIGGGVLESYYGAVNKCSLLDCSDSDIKVVYTPLNGTGLEPVLRILDDVGIKNVEVVSQQREPDSAFTTCTYPNPEVKEALALGVELCKKTGADLLLGTDPDCDRVGSAVLHNGEYHLLNGNQVGFLLLDLICRIRTEEGTMPENPMAIKTIVTSEMAKSVADKYGVGMINVLTGFKFIGEQIGIWEKDGEGERFIFGFEESYGYLSGIHARDKDAVNASMLIAEMAAYYKKQGKTLIDRLEELYAEHGYFYDRLENFSFAGEEGMNHMKALMKGLRDNRAEQLGGLSVSRFSDYLESKAYFADGRCEDITLPKSDVVGYLFEDGSSVTVRPSGTEPKIKVYYSLKSADKNEAEKIFGEVSKSAHDMLGLD